MAPLIDCIGQFCEKFGDGTLQIRNSHPGHFITEQPLWTEQDFPILKIRSAASAPLESSTLYLGIGVGVGGAILVSIIAVAVLIIRKRAEHSRAVTELAQQAEPVRIGQGQDIAEVPRPLSAARCSTLLPLHAKAGWGALSSDETLHKADPSAQTGKQKRNSISLPKRIRQRGIPLKRLKHLSAIMESPRSRAAKSPSPVVFEAAATPSRKSKMEKGSHRKTISLVHPAERDGDVFAAPDSPKPDVLPSYAIRSPGMYGAAIANDDRPKPPRSVSVSVLVGTIHRHPSEGKASKVSRPQMHARSISLGAPFSRPPSGPVPPVPVIAPHRVNSDERNRQGLCVSRMSSSSQESASSSVLVTSPILTMRADQGQTVGSPTVEQVIADDDSAQLKTVTNRQWQNPLITGPRPMEVAPLDETSRSRNHASIRSNIACYSISQEADNRHSISSTISTESIKGNRLSIPQIATADRVSISRVSSYNSLKGATGGVQKVVTPRKPSRHSSVSATGSPAERRKTSTNFTNSVLRDISHNAVSNMTPSRHASNATQDSGRSSNGNPFQWDQSLPLMKPSALKGSPSSKGSRGHKRQNCVRISTLTPQILGPPPSRPTSPSIMHGIEEEAVDGEEGVHSHAGGLRFVTNDKRLSRPLSASSFGHLRVQPLRASLTPSSPTLSTWTAYQEQYGLPSQHSDSQISVSPLSKNDSRLSELSSVSALSIPSFPSPSKATLSGVQLSQPVPEFCLSRPSTDGPEDDSSSPFALHMSSEDEDRHEDYPSSPPLPTSEIQEYDPAWPIINIPAPQMKQEYDPASPTWQTDMQPQHSSPDHSSPAFLPFAIPSIISGVCSDDDRISPHSRPSSYGPAMPDTPPCSPKTMPEGFQNFFDHKQPALKPLRSMEKLTSANASAIMATIPEDPPNVGFPTAVPVLPPPAEIGEPQTTPIGRRQRSVSNATHLQPLRPAPPPPIPSSDACVPSPLHIKQSPQGPRSEPAKSVLKNAMALRRMNSEIDQNRAAYRESRRYVHLRREPSPLLPFIGSPDPSESCNDLFDFDFGADTAAGAEAAAGALDEIDMTDLDRKLDGALAGFDAEPSSSASRASSVWEDGEKFWERMPDFHVSESSPVDVNVTPIKKDVRSCEDGTPVGRLLMPVMGGSIVKTPKSLYDSDGFYRET